MTTKTVDNINPTQVLMQMLSGFWVSQSLYAAVKLNLADYLKTGSCSVSVLAEKTGAHEDHLYRLLRALSSIGIFRELENKTFELTPVSELFQSDHPQSMRSVVLMLGQENYAAWGKLADAVQTGSTAFELAYGAQAYAYFAEHPESGALFNEALAALIRKDVASVAESYDFTGARCIVDVGGGNGMLLANILERTPQASGILFELPQVAQEAEQFLASAGLQARCKLVTGDFFKSVTGEGDIYILSRIMHTFDDARCVQILRNVHAAMPPEGKLLIMEEVLEPGNDPATARTKFMDLNMLVMAPGGREHTREEFERLLNEAGFSLMRVLPTPSGTAILEAKRL